MVGVKVDTSEFDKKMRFFNRTLGKTLAESYKELGALTAKKLASVTPPPGTGSKQREILKKSVLKDVSRAYWPVGRSANEIRKRSGSNMAAAYLEAVKSGDMLRAEEVVEKTILEIDSFSQQAPKGHLQGVRGGSKMRVGKTAQNAVSVVSKASIEAIKSKHVIKAGMAKAGWMAVVSKIGAKTKPPKWLRGGFGTFRLLNHGGNILLSIINEVRYSSKLLSQSDIKRAVGYSVRGHMKRMQIVLDKLTKKV